MIVLIVAMVGGVLVAVLAMLMGVDGRASIGIGGLGAVVLLVVLIGYLVRAIPREQARFVALFPTPDAAPASDEPTSTYRGSDQRRSVQACPGHEVRRGSVSGASRRHTPRHTLAIDGVAVAPGTAGTTARKDNP